MLVSLALLIWPGSYHRIVTKGVDTEEVHEFTSRVMQFALMPFAVAFGLDMFVAGERVACPLVGTGIGVIVTIFVLIFWYALEAFQSKRHTERKMSTKTESSKSPRTRLRDKIKHVGSSSDGSLWRLFRGGVGGDGSGGDGTRMRSCYVSAILRSMVWTPELLERNRHTKTFASFASARSATMTNKIYSGRFAESKG